MNHWLHFTVCEDGITLKSVLREQLAPSVAFLRSLKWREGAILVNGRPSSVRERLNSGDTVSVDIADFGEKSEHIIPVDYPLDIRYEDDDLIVLNKPAGLAVHSAPGAGEITVAGAVLGYLGPDYPCFHPVNRLDRGVTGLMAVAKNRYTHEKLTEALHTDAFFREYRGLCVGIPSPECGVIELPIGDSDDSFLKKRIAQDGKEAITEYEVLKSFPEKALSDGTLLPERALLRLRPITGRTHQLRLHTASIGHPLIGDWLYGTEERALIERPALHSYYLKLIHPVSGKVIELTAELPEDMKRLSALSFEP